MKTWIVAIAMSAMAGVSYAGNLCSINPFTKADGAQGKIAFDSHCAFCHQYSMTGRQPGNYKNELPDINVLSESDLKMIDGSAGLVPPLVGEKFFAKWRDKSFVDFSNTVSSASISFPTTDLGKPKTFFLIAAYVLNRNCGKM